MRDSWVETTLGDVARVTSGFAFSTNSWRDTGIPVIKINNVRNGHVSLVNCSFVSDPLPEGASRFLLKKGDLLITLTGEIGAVGFVTQTQPMYLNQRVGRIDLRDNKNVLLDFLGLFLTLPEIRAEMWSHGKGNAQLNISPTSIHSLKINLPPLPEQKRIVDLISSVDSYIEALQQQLESAKKSRNALIESQILKLSDSSLFSLKNLSTKIGSGATPRGGEEVYIETGVNLIRSQNVHDSNFVMRGLVAIEDSAAKALENVTVEEGDVLINITGASVTRCCVVDSTILPARVNQHVAIIRSDKAKILPKYLVLVLTSNEVKGFLNDIAGTGSTRQALTKTHLEDLEIPVPNISKQTEIIENSDAFDIAISKSQMALSGARILRSGLLNDLLSGEHQIPASYDKVIGAAR